MEVDSIAGETCDVRRQIIKTNLFKLLKQFHIGSKFIIINYGHLNEQ